MFKTPLTLRADPRADLWVVVEPLIWNDPAYGELVVPVGFVTDLASTPFHVDDDGPSRRPAAMHDALYKLMRRWGKDHADQFLRDSILVEGGGRIRSQIYYRAVSWFGAKAWRLDGAPVNSADFDTIKNFEAWRASRPLGASLARPSVNIS